MSLLLKFRDKDTPFGVTRETLQALSEQLGVNETMTIHYALSKLARDVLPGYEMDDGPLTPEDRASVSSASEAQMPKGKLRSKKSLF